MGMVILDLELPDPTLESLAATLAWDAPALAECATSDRAPDAELHLPKEGKLEDLEAFGGALDSAERYPCVCDTSGDSTHLHPARVATLLQRPA